MKTKLPYQMRKAQGIALMLLGVLVILFRLGFSYLKDSQKEKDMVIHFVSDENVPEALILTEFNPNDLDEKSWKQLGFTQKQAQTILKYKEIVGGAYISKEQFRKCYAVSEQKFQELKDYILLPETNKEAKSTAYTSKFTEKKSLNIRGKFNPDTYTQKDWQSLGFSENQANAILKYKNYLGGSFLSKEKFRECFIISEENYKKLAPYLMLPDKTPQNLAKINTDKRKSIIIYQNFDPNALSQEEWEKLGFSPKQAEVILNYKNKKLGGSFQSLEDVKNCFVISDRKFEEMRPYIQISSTAKNTEKQQAQTKAQPIQEATDFRKVDLNTITAEQLVEFGLDRKTAGSYIGFREKLGGFIDKNQIYEVYNIDRNLAEKLVQTCYLDTQSVSKYTLVTAPEAWLKTHPYFKYSADKIIYYRLTYPEDNKIWKLIKVKPEYETKMKWYLK